ncbi:MAG TPA: putative metalloprotease CJM1_0395 family protein [Armatimonadota bacterium]
MSPASGVQEREQLSAALQFARVESKVIAHEHAHQAVGGRYAGAASYSYTRGPDGRAYVTGGEVPIDLSPERDPSETAAKMRQVRSAALAPADPSPQDLEVASMAAAIEAQAAAEEIAQSARDSSTSTGQLVDFRA